MRRQTIFNTNVVYVRKGARLFPSESRNSPPVEKKPDIREMLKEIAKTDKEVEKLILKIRMELESPKVKKLRTKLVQVTPPQVTLPSVVLASASTTGEEDEQQAAIKWLYDHLEIEEVSARSKEEDT